jgi:hypothetical protein
MIMRAPLVMIGDGALPVRARTRVTKGPAPRPTEAPSP